MTLFAINTEHDLASSGDKIRFLIMEVLFYSATSNHACSNKLCNWVIPKAILLPLFLSKVIIMGVQASATEILKTFTTKILEHQTES